jgi:hypothetical protein
VRLNVAFEMVEWIVYLVESSASPAAPLACSYVVSSSCVGGGVFAVRAQVSGMSRVRCRGQKASLLSQTASRFSRCSSSRTSRNGLRLREPPRGRMCVSNVDEDHVAY